MRNFLPRGWGGLNSATGLLIFWEKYSQVGGSHLAVSGKVPGLNLKGDSGLVWSLHVLFVPAWVSSGYSSFLP